MKVSNLTHTVQAVLALLLTGEIIHPEEGFGRITNEGGGYFEIKHFEEPLTEGGF